MFLIELALAVFSYIVAKSIWHFVVLPIKNDVDTHNIWIWRIADAMVVCVALAPVVFALGFVFLIVFFVMVLR